MIPLYKPYMPEYLPELNNILHSGKLSYGEWGRIFETKLYKYLNVKHLLTTSSYSTAHAIALEILGLKPGDEVIASPMSCLASTMPLLTYGLRVKWADIDPRTGTLDPDSVKKVLTSKTKLIFHNHFCGYPGYVDEINLIGRTKGIPVIDDCIESFGSTYKGRSVGNWGADVTILSFQTVRLPNALDGGAIILQNEELYKKAILARDFGINRKQFRDENGEISKQCDITTHGVAGTLNEINSYIGSQQMEDLPRLFQKQKENAKIWHEHFQSRFDVLDSRAEIEPNYWIFGLLTNSKIKTMMAFRNHGFYASSVHLPNSYYSVFGHQEKMKGTEEFYNKFLAIPCGWWY